MSDRDNQNSQNAGRSSSGQDADWAQQIPNNPKSGTDEGLIGQTKENRNLTGSTTYETLPDQQADNSQQGSSKGGSGGSSGSSKR